MSQLASTLSVRLARNLCLRLQYWTAAPTNIRSYWSAQISRGTGPTHRQQLSFSYGERTPRFCELGDTFGEPALWVGSSTYAIPVADRDRVAAWIAATEKLNTPEGADRAVSKGASHADRDSAAAKPGDVQGAPQRTPHDEEDPRGLQRAGGSAVLPAGSQGYSLPGVL